VLVGRSHCSSTHSDICNDSMGGRLFVVWCKQHNNEKKRLLGWKWPNVLECFVVLLTDYVRRYTVFFPSHSVLAT
jgi:hypothetical protein